MTFDNTIHVLRQKYFRIARERGYYKALDLAIHDLAASEEFNKQLQRILKDNLPSVSIREIKSTKTD